MVEHEDTCHNDAGRTSVIGWLMSFLIWVDFFSSSRLVGILMRAASQVILNRLNSP
jgi:hypothetical protein